MLYHFLRSLFFATVLAMLIVDTTDFAKAGVVTLTTDQSMITADGVIDWSVIGPAGTVIGDPAFTIDIQGTPFVATVSEPPLPPQGYNPPAFRRREESDGFIVQVQGGAHPTGFTGFFSTGESLLNTGFDGYNNLGFQFSTPVRGFGLQIHSTFFDRTSVFVNVFDTDGFSIGNFVLNAKPIKIAPNPIFDGQTGDGSASFVGVRSTAPEIGAVLFNYETPDGYNSIVVNNPVVEIAFEGPTGLSPEDAFVPSFELPNEEGGWEFDGVLGTGRWFDPPAASGYQYETDGLSNFTTVILPATVGDADGKFQIDDLINAPVEVMENVPYTFPTPVEKFVVLGIDPTVDGGNPLAFPTFLAFDQTTVSFTQTPIGIPEPGTLLLGILAIGERLRRRRRYT